MAFNLFDVACCCGPRYTLAHEIPFLTRSTFGGARQWWYTPSRSLTLGLGIADESFTDIGIDTRENGIIYEDYRSLLETVDNYFMIACKVRPELMPLLVEWVQSGGRLYCMGEYHAPPLGLTLQTIQERNQFLADLGSSIQIVPSAIGLPGDYSICGTSGLLTSDCDSLIVSYASKINGGTTCLTLAGETVGAVEAIGDGFVLCIGDVLPYIGGYTEGDYIANYRTHAEIKASYDPLWHRWITGDNNEVM